MMWNEKTTDTLGVITDDLVMAKQDEDDCVEKLITCLDSFVQVRRRRKRLDSKLKQLVQELNLEDEDECGCDECSQ